mgnify:CR=1 FL=1
METSAFYALLVGSVIVLAILSEAGLECNTRTLFGRLPGATLIAGTNIVATGGLGFVAAYALLGWSLVPSLFVAVALTTTSIGVSTRVWGRYRSLGSREGEMMLDVAEIDDLSGGVLLALLLLGAAIVGKGLGSFVPARTTMTSESAGLLAISLLPRSEITLVIMQRGLDLEVVSRNAFTSVVLVVVVTMVGVPLLLLFLLPDGDDPDAPVPSGS